MPLPTRQELRLLQDTADSIGAVVAPYAAAMDENEAYAEELLDVLRRRGVWEILVPREEQPSLTAQSLVLEEVARRCTSTAMLLHSQTAAAHTLMLAKTPVGEPVLDGLSHGQAICGWAVSEPDAGSDVLAMRTTARRDGSDYLITGQKRWITNAGLATSYIVFARTASGRARDALTAFLIPADAPGLTVARHERKMGLRASPTGDLVLANVRVSQDTILGSVGDGMRLAMDTLLWSRTLIGSVAVGLARGAYEEAASYATERRQFDRPIIEFQAVGHLLSDMLMQVSSARALLYEITTAADRADGSPRSWEAAAIKACGSDVAMKTTTDAVQIHGGYGYCREYAVERMMRDAKVLQIFEGTNQIQRNTIMREIPKLTGPRSPFLRIS